MPPVGWSMAALQANEKAMTVTIHFPSDLENSLRQHAARSGQEIGDFVVQAVKEKIAKTPGLEESCEPLTEAIAASSVSDEEFDQFFEEVREEVWQEKQGKGG